MQMPCFGEGAVAVRTTEDESTYTVQVFRDGGFWILDVPELTATGQARSLATAKDTARELVALEMALRSIRCAKALAGDRVDDNTGVAAMALESKIVHPDHPRGRGCGSGSAITVFSTPVRLSSTPNTASTPAPAAIATARTTAPSTGVRRA